MGGWLFHFIEVFGAYKAVQSTGLRIKASSFVPLSWGKGGRYVLATLKCP